MSSGVWTFGRGVTVEKSRKRKALLHMPSGEVVWSYASLEAKLTALGWERYQAAGSDDDALLQYHKRGSVDLISLPKDFANFQSIHMLDIVTKNRDAFRIVDADISS